MSSAISETATWEASVIAPDGTDPRTAASLRTALQDLANRTKFLKESFIDVQGATTTAADSDYNNASFADVASLASLSFTNVKVGDKLILLASSNWDATVFTADGSDPFVEMRWLVGATDATISAASAYPRIAWGTSIGATPTDSRSLVCLSSYTVAADAGSLAAKVQARVSASFTVVNPFTSIVGVHLRLGA